MLNQDYTCEEFLHLIKNIDFKKYFDKLTKKEIKNLFMELETFVKTEYDFHSIDSKELEDGKFYYKLNNVKKDKSNLKEVLFDDFVLRKTNKNIKRVYGIEQSNRFKIIKTLINFFNETNDFYILKLDISKFYESIDREEILKKLNVSILLSYKTKQILKNFFSKIKTPGLPRGVNISATLSEYYMKNFDKYIKIMDGIFFYARYVDDIIILSTKKIDFCEIQKNLPKGLNFNLQKKIEISAEEKKWSFPFLGYSFEKKEIIKKNKKDYNIKISISKRKIKNIQSKIIKAFLDFRKKKDLKLLKNRMLFLSANYPIKNNKINTSDYSEKRTLHGGNAFNYPFISSHEELKKLDIFYYKVLNTKTFKKINSCLQQEERKMLRKYSFVCGYKQRILRNFNLNEIQKITECWR